MTDYTLGLEVFTALLFCTALGQAGLFVWQLRLMREGINDANRAAEGAQATASATADVAVAVRQSAETAMLAF